MIYLDKKQIDKNLRDIALAIRAKILRDTTNEIDMNGNRFKEYSPAYVIAKAQYRSKRGVKIGDKAIAGASVVNLTLTGKMLRNMAVAKIAGGYQIFFPEKSMAIRAWWHHTGQGNNPERKFFGVSAETERQLFNKYMQPPLKAK